MKKQKSKPADSITCRELILVDDKGAMRARFTTELAAYPSIRMYDKDGCERFVLDVDDDGVSRICFMTKDSKMAMGIALAGNQPRIRFYDESMKCVGEVGLDDELQFRVRSSEPNNEK